MSEAAPPLVSIIVVTHNSRRYLPRLIECITKQTERRWRLTIVDNASRPEERPNQAELPRETQLMQFDSNIGFAAANNVAAKDAGAPLLAFLNPDAFPEPGWLANLVELAGSTTDAAAIGSTQICDTQPDLLDGSGDVMHASGVAYRSGYRQKRRPPPLAETFSACAAAMLVRREAFEHVGGFDERYFCYFEDVDLGFRLRLQGYRVLQSPDAVVRHVGGGSSAATAFSEFHGSRNRLWTYVKCMPGALFWLLLPAHIVLTAILSSVALVRGRGPHAWRGIVQGWSNIAPIWQSRRHVQAARRVGVADLAKAMVWSPDVFFTRRPFPRAIGRKRLALVNPQTQTTK